MHRNVAIRSAYFAVDKELSISSVNCKVCSQSRGHAGCGRLSPQATQRELLFDVQSTIL